MARPVCLGFVALVRGCGGCSVFRRRGLVCRGVGLRSRGSWRLRWFCRFRFVGFWVGFWLSSGGPFAALAWAVWLLAAAAGAAAAAVWLWG